METRIGNATEENVQKAAEVLRNGGIVAFPTDTVYGLGAVCTNETAVSKLFQAKGRDEGKPLSVLVGNLEQVKELSETIPESAYLLMRAFWPGALTVVLQKKPEVSDRVSAGRETIGIRMPDSDTARMLIRLAGSPLAAPSANTSGKRSAVTAEEVKEDLFGKIDFLLDGGRCPLALSSTVVDLTGAEPEILREGSITKAMIDEALGGR